MNTLFISTRQVAARLARGERLVFLDCRSERACGDRPELPGAIRAASDALATVADHLPGRGCTAIAFAEHGWEDGPVRLVELLRARGWTDVRILSGGLSAWSALKPRSVPSFAPLTQHV